MLEGWGWGGGGGGGGGGTRGGMININSRAD